MRTICEQCANLLNASCPLIKYWPEDGSLEPKHVASCVLMTTCCVWLNKLLYHFLERRIVSQLVHKFYTLN